ncbi:two-component system, sensor histidine kinase and response regulator [Candidatus Magnetomoraceae bacterium gMMP-13]
MKIESIKDAVILAVDDNPINLSVLFNYLGKFGFTVLVVKSGEKALELIEKRRPDIILLDIMMPGINGFEICRLLKEKKETSNLPIIFMSALSETIDKVKGFELGCVDYITKPFHHEEVLARVSTHLHIQKLKNSLDQKNKFLMKEIAEHKQTEDALERARLKITRKASQLENRNKEMQKVNLWLEKSIKFANKMVAEVEAANRAKSEFLAVMSHEIRTPMNGILGMAEIMLNTELLPDQREYLEIIRNSGEYLLSIINDILDFSKIESGRMKLEKEPFELKPCIKEIIKVMTSNIIKKNINLIYTFDPEIPPFINGDIIRIRQILFNLVGNAIKFTEQGQISISVKKYKKKNLVQKNLEINETKEDSTFYLIFSIKDTGIGIPIDKIDLLFDSFSQVNASTTRKYGGTGLGLAISLRLVQLMGGKLWVESTPGKGSTFFFTINTKAEQPIHKETADKKQIDYQISKQHPMRILVAEDNLVNQKVTLRMLKEIGYKGDIVDNGLQAVEAVKQQIYDVVLMDIMMPKMNGLEAAHHIREELPKDRQPRIIAMTADAMEGRRKKYIDEGMDDYISKPVRIKDLIKVLNISTQIDKTIKAPVKKIETDPESCINLNRIYSLASGIESVVIDLINTFLDEAPQEIAKIKEAKTSNDAKKFQIEAHALKSSSALFGANSISKRCKIMEDAGSNEKLELISEENIMELKEEYEIVKKALEKVIESKIIVTNSIELNRKDFFQVDGL